MNWVLPSEVLITWMLGTVRVGALLLSAPIFGHMAVSRQVRAGLALALLLVIGPMPAEGFSPLEASGVEFAGATVREMLIGVTIGFGTRLLFGAFSLFGEIVSIESGLGHARVLDPNTGATSVALASLFDLFMIVAFFAVDGHHLMIQTVARSFELWPVGGAALAPSVYGQIAYLGAPLFEIGVRLAMPVVVAMMVSNLALGILARSVPQLNLMMIQLPAHVALGLVIVSFGAGTVMRASGREIEMWAERVLGALAGS